MISRVVAISYANPIRNFEILTPANTETASMRNERPVQNNRLNVAKALRLQP